MTHIALLFVIQSASHQNATHHALSQRMLSAMLNAKNRSVKLNAQTRVARCLIAQNVLLSANNPTVLPIAKPPSQNASQFVKNPNATGNATNLTAQNQNVSLFARTPIVFLKLNAALAQWDKPEYPTLCHSLKNKNKIKNLYLNLQKILSSLSTIYCCLLHWQQSLFCSVSLKNGIGFETLACPIEQGQHSTLGTQFGFSQTNSHLGLGHWGL